MKIRIKDNTVRLRLSQSEVNQLKSENKVKASIQFPGKKLTYALQKSQQSNLTVEYKGDEILILAPSAVVENWVNTELVGFDSAIHLEEGSLEVLVEKDFKCSLDRGEDESDLFDPI